MFGKTSLALVLISIRSFLNTCHSSYQYIHLKPTALKVIANLRGLPNGIAKIGLKTDAEYVADLVNINIWL